MELFLLLSTKKTVLLRVIPSEHIVRSAGTSDGVGVGPTTGGAQLDSYLYQCFKTTFVLEKQLVVLLLTLTFLDVWENKYKVKIANQRTCNSLQCAGSA